MIRFPPKKILVPFDLSHLSIAAWKQASVLAERYGAALEAVYVEEPLPLSEFGLFEIRDPRELKRETLRHIRAEIGTQAKIHYFEGEALVNILRLARIEKPDLLVMGTHGRKGLERLWLGSVSEGAARLSPVPVWTVREKPRQLDSVLAPVNFTNYSEHGLTFAAGVAAALRVPLTALHVCTDPQKCPQPRERLQAWLERLPEEVRRACSPRAAVRFGSPTEEILKASLRHGLVVLVAHRKSLLQDMALGMTAERVMRHCHVPVLTVHEPSSAPSWKEFVSASGKKII